MDPSTTKPVLSISIFVAIAKLYTVLGQNYRFLLCQKALGYYIKIMFLTEKFFQCPTIIFY